MNSQSIFGELEYNLTSKQRIGINNEIEYKCDLDLDNKFGLLMVKRETLTILLAELDVLDCHSAGETNRIGKFSL